MTHFLVYCGCCCCCCRFVFFFWETIRCGGINSARLGYIHANFKLCLWLFMLRKSSLEVIFSVQFCLSTFCHHKCGSFIDINRCVIVYASFSKFIAHYIRIVTNRTVAMTIDSDSFGRKWVFCRDRLDMSFANNFQTFNASFRMIHHHLSLSLSAIWQ